MMENRYRIKKVSDKMGNVSYTPQYRVWPFWFTIRVWYNDAVEYMNERRKELSDCDIFDINTGSYIGYSSSQATEQEARWIIEYHKLIKENKITIELL